ncbi:hypothetical protein H072_6896 [Dactylellina haptotyla CBS 200.50]|uniref:Uncharacterized protein n=1 Tax=Dactylellina haptotyla (strain CBS 200.50) TaxID=1284197 RepID=S8A8Y6_DACHA|nr:hypothetical protein H072_6896 [Dactylellina haptotyla CBS 200.50]
MRSLLFGRLICALLFSALVANALPSAPPGSPDAVERREDPSVKDFMEPGVMMTSDIEVINTRSVEAVSQSNSDRLSRREPEAFTDPIPPLEPEVPPKDSDREWTEKRSPSLETVEKREDNAAYVMKRDPAGQSPGRKASYLKHSNALHPKIKAKLRSRISQETEAREVLTRKARAAKDARARADNAKRSYKEKSPLQGYSNKLPAAAYAADDGSFGHSISRRDRAPSLRKRAEERFSEDARLVRRAILEARLQELGYAPKPVEEEDNDDDAPDPYYIDKRRIKRDDISAGQDGGDDAPDPWFIDKKRVKRGEEELVKRDLKKRDFDTHIGCPSLRVMDAPGLLLFNPDYFRERMAIFRNECFKCGCRTKRGGWYMEAREDYGCTDHLVLNCMMIGCMCLADLDRNYKGTTAKPAWHSSDKDSHYSMETYDPLNDQTYGDRYAAEAGVNETPISLRRRDLDLEGKGGLEKRDGLDAGISQVNANEVDRDEERSDEKPHFGVITDMGIPANP